MAELAYPTLVYLHLLLFVLWLGADVGVFLIGQHFRKRHVYDLPQRLALLKMLVVIDMVPRTAWALMVPVSLSVVTLGGWWAAPSWLVALSWIIAALWLFLAWDAHLHDQTPRATRDRRIEMILKIKLVLFYLGLGIASLVTGTPLAQDWLAWKALLFGLIFVAAIMIDVQFKPLGPQLARLIDEGSSDATELRLLTTLTRTSFCVGTVYLLLIATSYLGSVKPF